jgi:hypothetical protein
VHVAREWQSSVAGGKNKRDRQQPAAAIIKLF